MARVSSGFAFRTQRDKPRTNTRNMTALCTAPAPGAPRGVSRGAATRRRAGARAPVRTNAAISLPGDVGTPNDGTYSLSGKAINNDSGNGIGSSSAAARRRKVVPAVRPRHYLPRHRHTF